MTEHSRREWGKITVDKKRTVFRTCENSKMYKRSRSDDFKKILSTALYSSLKKSLSQEAELKLEVFAWTRQDHTMRVLSDLSVLYFYLFKSSYLGLYTCKWRIRHGGGYCGRWGGLDHLALKYLVCKSLNICSLGLRSMSGFTYLCI